MKFGKNHSVITTYFYSNTVTSYIICLLLVTIKVYFVCVSQLLLRQIHFHSFIFKVYDHNIKVGPFSKIHHHISSFISYSNTYTEYTFSSCFPLSWVLDLLSPECIILGSYGDILRNIFYFIFFTCTCRCIY